jgi:hypothetical protein
MVKVLIVQSATENNFQFLWRRRLMQLGFEHKIEWIEVAKLAEAEAAFLKHKDSGLALIAVAARVESNSVDGDQLVRSFREQGFGGPIFTMSSDWNYVQRLVKAGGGEPNTVGCDRLKLVENVIDKLRELKLIDQS